VKVVVYVMCLALVAHELVGLLVHSPGQLDTWLVARCMKGEWEWEKAVGESSGRHEQLANRADEMGWQMDLCGERSRSRGFSFRGLLLSLFRTARDRHFI
jgi:hypothetical protein